MNRRDFAKLAALSPLGFMLVNPLLAAGNVLPRENINTFSRSADNVAKLRKAVEALSGRPVTDWSSWFNMAGIHMIGASDVAKANPPEAVSALYNQCHSDESLFFVWHRAYVWSMERLMQDAISDTSFRLPYWDWYTNPELPEIFRSEVLADGKTGNVLYRANRNNGVNKGNPIWNPRITAGFDSGAQNSDFERFQNRLNGGEHGNIHVAVGTQTNMGDTHTAARDPIFWLHHANIDRLLPVWLRIDAGRKARTNYPNWLATKYRFPAPGGGLQTPTVDDMALNGMEALGYSYEDTSSPKVSAPATPLKPVRSAGSLSPSNGKATMKIAEKQSVKIGAGATVSLTLSDGDHTKMQSMASEAKTDDGFTSVMIVLEGIKLDKPAPDVLGYDVYLNLPDKAPDSSKFDQHYLGPISLFALTHEMPEHEGMNHGITLRFAATEMLKEQAKANRFGANNMSVSIIPVLAPNAKEPDEAVIEIENISIEASSNPVQ